MVQHTDETVEVIQSNEQHRHTIANV